MKSQQIIKNTTIKSAVLLLVFGFYNNTTFADSLLVDVELIHDITKNDSKVTNHADLGSISGEQWQNIENQIAISSQQAYIKASNTGNNDLFGWSVAMDGNTLVIGAKSEQSNATGINGNQINNSASNSGAVYVFIKTGRVWSQQAYIKASNTDSGDKFGTSVAISGDTLVVGAPFEQSNASGINGDESDNSLLGSGAAYVFVRNAGIWQQQAYLKGTNNTEGQQFGNAVAMVNDKIAIGAWRESNLTLRSGAVYVFERNSGVWSQHAYLKAPNAETEDRFGESLALTESTTIEIVLGEPIAVTKSTLLIGAPNEDSNAIGVNGDQNNNSALSSGAAYVFEKIGNNWDFQTYLKASNTNNQDNFGTAVDIDGNTLVISAVFEGSSSTGVNGDEGDNSSASAGAAYIFTQNQGVWSQQAYLKASNTDSSDQFGQHVSIDGDIVVVSARWEQSNATGINGNDGDNSVNAAGAVYSYERTNNSWQFIDYIKQSNTAQSPNGDWFGTSTTLSNQTLVVGAPWEDSSATGIGGDENNNSLNSTGAAYVYHITTEILFKNSFE